MKLLGNRVLLRRIEVQERPHASGLFLADPYAKGSCMFEVLQVGPGRWLYHPFKKSKKVFIKPEVQVGDVVFSTHWHDASEVPTWHKPEYLDGVDGRGRVALDARFCLAAFPQPEIPQFIPKSHI